MIRIQTSEMYLDALPQPNQGLAVFSGQEATGIYIPRDLLLEQRAHWDQATEPIPLAIKKLITCQVRGILGENLLHVYAANWNKVSILSVKG